jgi:hypothetical protein
MGLMALLYNWGFFTMLGYAPYPMKLDAHELGLVFTGWGVLVALFAVFFAPRLQRRFGTAPVLYANMLGLAVVMAVIALGVATPAVVVVAVIVSGAFIGINNTLTTQAVMLVAPVERSVASSSYGFIRFIGGGLAPFVAGKIAEATNQSVAFWVGAVAFLLAIPVLASGHKLVAKAEREAEEPEVVRPTLEPLSPVTRAAGRPVVVAVRANESAAGVVDQAALLARRDGAPLEIVHVRETDVVEELAVSPETEEEARAAVTSHLDRLAAKGLTARGLVLHSVGDRAAAAEVLARHAADVEARALVVRRSARSVVSKQLDARLASVPDGSARPELVLVDTQPGAPQA